MRLVRFFSFSLQTMDDFEMLKVLGKGTFGKVSTVPSYIPIN